MSMHADGGFYSDAFNLQATLYNPYKLAVPTVTPTKNRVVSFITKLDKFVDVASFYAPLGNTGKTAAQAYTANLDSFLANTVSPLAKSQITSVTLGSLNVATAVNIPYDPSNPSSAAATSAAVDTLTASLGDTSTLSTIFPATDFGTSSVSNVNVAGMLHANRPSPRYVTSS